jgi:hypothetical protein
VEDSASDDAEGNSPQGYVDCHATLATALVEAAVCQPNSQDNASQNE